MWSRTGIHVEQISEFFQLGKEEPFLTLITCPKLPQYIQVKASHGSEYAQFGTTVQDLQALCREHSLDPGKFFQPSLLASGLLLSAIVESGSPVTFEIAVDTDGEAFRNDAQAATEGSGRMAVELNIVLIQEQQIDWCRLHLTLTPAKKCDDDRGFLALDPGTSGTKIVHLEPGFWGIHDITTIACNGSSPRLVEVAEPVKSVVRVKVGPDEKSPLTWEVGGEEQPIEGVIQGAIPRAVSPLWQEAQSIAIQRSLPGVVPSDSQPSSARAISEMREILNYLPAIKLVAEVLHLYRCATFRRPNRLTFTYPTVFNGRELSQLRQVIYAALLHCRGTAIPANLEDLEKPSREFFSFLIDVATATAYFYLYKKVLAAPGALIRFRYLYPAGLNLLVVDVGKSSTSVALVNAQSPSDRPGHVRISVRGRGGLREFGGDNFTVAIFQIFKARLACWIQAVRKGTIRLSMPDENQPEKLQGWLNDNADAIELYVPTRFKPELNDEEQRRRRQQCYDLYIASEQGKRQLENEESTTLSLSEKSWLVQELARRLPEESGRDLQAAIKKIRVSRREVDALVAAEVRSVADLCNRLIERSLGEALDEVHWVVLSGNGCLYPRLLTELREHLRVAFLNDRLTIDRDNLNGGAAKGAVLAFATREAAGAVDVEFDRDLHERLPFDVGYRDHGRGEHRILYRVDQRYADLGEVKLEILRGSGKAAMDGSDLKNVVLDARRPGDQAFAPYLQFVFPDGVHGPVTIRPDGTDFVAQDADDTDAIRVELVSPQHYIALVQQGRL
jgi:hypothetical protein